LRALLAAAAFVACSVATWSASADVLAPVTCSSSGDAGGAACTDERGLAGVCVDVDARTTCRTACPRLDAPCCGAGDMLCTIGGHTAATCPVPASGSVCMVGVGYCVAEADGQYCAPSDTPCTGAKSGAVCALEDGTRGTCVVDPIVADAGYSQVLCRPSGNSASSCAATPGVRIVSWTTLAGLGAVAALVAGRRRTRRPG
jgi:hypothetical protein